MKLFVSILVVFVLCSNAFAQGDVTKPLPPMFEVLSLDPATGIPTLTWTPPESDFVHPDPTGYIIYIPHESGGWFPYHFLDPDVTSFTDLNNSGLKKTVSYRIASNGETEPSPQTPEHSSILLTVQFDSCSNSLNLSWTHYVGWGDLVVGYEIYMGSTPQWLNHSHVGSASGTDNSINLSVDFNTTYYLYVMAKKLNSSLYSCSNQVEISTKVAREPDFMEIDSLVASDIGTNIFFRIDTLTEFRNFSLVRWESSDSISSLGTATSVLSFSNPKIKQHTDASNWHIAQSKPFYYKIDGYDGCERNVMVSNMMNTIILSVTNMDYLNTISWNQLFTKANNSVSYTLYRILSSDSEAIPEVLMSEINPSYISFNDDISNLGGEGYEAKICYFMEAKELDLLNQPITLSRSRTFCLEVLPQIVMPNAIDPLNSSSMVSDGRHPRNYFAPTINFTASYTLTIYNRWGVIVFQGQNEGWDGRLPNGDLAREGAYVYRLEVSSETRKSTTKTGTVTVMYGTFNR